MSAVEVHNLRKEFVRKDGRKRTRVAALHGLTFDDGARRVHRDPGPERLGQVDAGPAALHAAPAGRRERAHLRPRHLRDAGGAAARQPRLGRGVVLQEDVRDREPGLRGALLRADAEGDARADPRDPRPGRLPGSRAHARDGEPVPRHPAEGGARARAPHLAGAAPARRADDRARPALEARGAGLHPRGAGGSTTRRSCSAPTTSPRPRSSPSGSGSSHDGGSSASSPPTRSSSATASRRWRRRSSPRPARRSRTSGQEEEEEVTV